MTHASDRMRAKAATGIEHALHAAETPASSISAAVPIARHSVLDCRPQLEALAGHLRSPQPVQAEGVALTLELLSNSDSPLYQADLDLDVAIGEIESALDGNVE